MSYYIPLLYLHVVIWCRIQLYENNGKVLPNVERYIAVDIVKIKSIFGERKWEHLFGRQIWVQKLTGAIENYRNILVWPRRWYIIYGNSQLTIVCGISDSISESNTICAIFVIWIMIAFIYFPWFWAELVPSFGGQIEGSTFNFQRYHCWTIQSGA